MFAYIKPLSEETLIIEIDISEALDLHGAIVMGGRTREFPSNLLSILEAFYAGTDMSRFAPEDEDEDEDVTPYANQGTPAPVPFTDRPNTPPQFRNHGEEIDATIRAHNLVNKPPKK